MNAVVPVLGLAFLAALVAGGVSAAEPAAVEPATDPAQAVEATSLLGRPLVRPALPADVVAEHEAALLALRARAAADPDDADARVWIGRHLGYLGRYGEAVEAFSEGAVRFPGDARFLRHRGHRHLSLRRLDAAGADLEAGLALAAGRPDVVEPDGLPNLYNRPTSTLKTNLWYHLGLARYLQGDFRRAAEAFAACAALADNPDMLVAATYWRWLALRRDGRDDDAAAAVDVVPRDVVVIENDDYARLLDLFRGAVTADELLAGLAPGSVAAATVGYGVGAWHVVAGREAEAVARFRAIVDGDGWAAFGFLAAEAELARAGG